MSFNRDRGGRDFKRRDSFGGGRDRGRPQMHEAICSDCGKRCEVPFKPTNDKPIYCSECFENHGGRRPERDGQRRDRFPERRENSFSNRNDAPRNEYKEQFDKLNAKIDIVIKMLASKEEIKEVAKETKKTTKKKVVSKKKK